MFALMNGLTILCLPLFLGLLSSTAAQQPPGPMEHFSLPYEIESNTAKIELPDLSSKFLRGELTTVIKWLNDVDTPRYYFHLNGLIVDSIVTVGSGGNLESDGILGENHHYAVVLAIPRVTGNIDTVRVYYSGTMTTEPGSSPWGGVHWTDSILYAMGVGFQAPYVSTTRHWLPLYDHPSVKPRFEVTFNVPKGIMAVSNGILTERNSQENREYWKWKSIGAASYLLTFGAGPFVSIADTTAEPPIWIFTRVKDSANSEKTYSRVRDMVSCFESNFFMYPYEKIGFINTPLGAMEHQTLINIPYSVVRSGNSNHSVIAHELAHQWFGNYCSVADFRHIWLSESFATWCEALWTECNSGYESYLKTIADKAILYMKTISVREGIMPLHDFPREHPSSNYPETIYQKGAVVIGMLRAILGDQTFYNLLARHLHTYQNATTEAFIYTLQKTIGNQAYVFANEWITGTGWPKVSINITKVPIGKSVRLKQRQSSTHEWQIFTTVPVNVVFRDSVTMELVDTVMFFNPHGELTFHTLDTFSINAGGKCRSLIEIVETSYMPPAMLNLNDYRIFADSYGKVNVERSKWTDGGIITLFDLLGRAVTSVSYPAGDTPIGLGNLPPNQHLLCVISEHRRTPTYLLLPYCN